MPVTKANKKPVPEKRTERKAPPSPPKAQLPTCYNASGKQSGSCGHAHEIMWNAERCRRLDVADGGSDRVVVAVVGDKESPLTATEQRMLDKAIEARG